MPAWSWSRTSTIVDGWVTLFTLPLITTVLVTLAVRRQRRQRRLERLAGLGAHLPWVALLPVPLAQRAPLAGAGLVAALGLPLAAALAVAGDMGHDTFVVYKACLAVVLGALVTPPLALRAMAER